MKKAVYFTGFNAIEYYGHQMHLTDDESAEYFVVLNDSDKIFTNDEFGVMLQRGNIQYTQDTKMSRFKGVNFIPRLKYFKGYGWDKADGENPVQLKLIKAA